MRLRNVKNKKEILDSSEYIIKDYHQYKGKWSSVFGNSNPIFIEIGMGKGQFIMNNAINNPDINYIGIEKFDSVMAKGVQKIVNGLDNLVLLRADALDIDNIFDHDVSKVFLNFSDPWPKNRHHLRRLSSKVFLDKYDNIFKDNKVIEMKTDNRELFQYSLVSFSEHGYLLKDVSLDLHNDKEDIVTTEYEDKFVKKGMPIYYVECHIDMSNKVKKN